MSSQRHTITKLTIELHLPSRDEAWELQNEVSAAYQRLVLEELERIFDALIESNEVVIVTRLEIDAGEIEQLSELPRALKTSAEEAVRQLLHNARQSPDGNAEVRITGENGEQLVTEVQIRHRTTTDAGRLRYFLQYGVLPAGSADESIREITLRLLENEPANLRVLLQQLSSYKRLAVQFSEDMLIRLLRVFHPDAEMRITLNRRLQDWFPAARIKNCWEAAFRLPETGVEYAALLLKELSLSQREEAEAQLISSAEVTEEDTLLKAALEKVNTTAALPAQQEPRLQQAAGALAQQLQRFLQHVFRGAGDALAVSEKSFAAFFSAGTVSPAEFRRILEQLRNALLIIAAEPADTAQAQKLGTRLTLQRLSVALAQLLEAKQAFGKGHDFSAGEEQPLLREDFTAAGIKPGERPEKNEQPEEVLQRIAEEQALREELKRIELLAQEALDETMGADEAAADGLPPEAGEGIYIRNAGLVLFGPFLRQFFTELGFVEEDVFVDEEAQLRAVHVLQYLATGENDEVEEHELVLNKLLCGLDLAEVVPLSVTLTEAEMAECEDLLHAVIRNWEVLKRTSPAGLRANFILREGRLSVNSEDEWDLLLERTTADLLLDSLPYSIDTLRLPWMPAPLFTEW